MPLSLVAFGGGTNSTAMLIGMVERGDPAPHAILFADTGGERPETYAHNARFSSWLVAHGYPPVITVQRVNDGGNPITLEGSVKRLRVLPSIAYGWKTCSQKFKIQPQDKWANNDPGCRASWAAGGKVIKLVGYDADEPQRAEKEYQDKYERRYPLIEWGWGRDECVAAIARAGLPQPGKSSCFFCPNMEPGEIRALAAEHPDLLSRALEIEDGALSGLRGEIKGLGRDWSWRTLLSQGDLFSGFVAVPMPCGCYDGEGE